MQSSQIHAWNQSHPAIVQCLFRFLLQLERQQVLSNLIERCQIVGCLLGLIFGRDGCLVLLNEQLHEGELVIPFGRGGLADTVQRRISLRIGAMHSLRLLMQQRANDIFQEIQASHVQSRLLFVRHDNLDGVAVEFILQQAQRLLLVALLTGQDKLAGRVRGRRCHGGGEALQLIGGPGKHGVFVKSRLLYVL